jgi:hypothetical protein
MYADDVALFVKPVRDDIATMAEILDIFGRASGLLVNRSNCAIYPVHCEEVDVEAAKQDFQCPIKFFPCTYLGLPLHYRQLRRVEIQPLIDKVGNKLPTWKGQFLNRAGRLKLMTTVLTAMPTFFLTVFPPKKWLVKRLDKLRRGFLWKGTEDARGGHYLVQWAKVKRPKALGGLGVLDFERFSRALRLRWLWFQWIDPAQPWVGTDVPCGEEDKLLFRASTCVTTGNGAVVRFWESPWLGGRALRDIAPRLFRLAWRKNQSFQEDLQDDRWTRGLWRMTTAEKMAELVVLWSMLQEVQLTDRPDEIKWWWTSHGAYAAKSAYQAQFFGSYCSFDSKAIWKSKTEDKHCFFAWLLLQCKLLTADKLLKQNWPCNPLCPLYDHQEETTEHMCLHCVFA